MPPQRTQHSTGLILFISLGLLLINNLSAASTATKSVSKNLDILLFQLDSDTASDNNNPALLDMLATLNPSTQNALSNERKQQDHALLYLPGHIQDNHYRTGHTQKINLIAVKIALLYMPGCGRKGLKKIYIERRQQNQKSKVVEAIQQNLRKANIHSKHLHIAVTGNHNTYGIADSVLASTIDKQDTLELPQDKTLVKGQINLSDNDTVNISLISKRNAQLEQINETRRIKNGQIHFFDGGLVGIIIQIQSVN